MDEPWRFIDTALLAWVRKAESGSIETDASAIYGVVINDNDAVKHAQFLERLIEVNPDTHASILKEDSNYADCVDVARQVLVGVG